MYDFDTTCFCIYWQFLKMLFIFTEHLKLVELVKYWFDRILDEMAGKAYCMEYLNSKSGDIAIL